MPRQKPWRKGFSGIQSLKRRDSVYQHRAEGSKIYRARCVRTPDRTVAEASSRGNVEELKASLADIADEMRNEPPLFRAKDFQYRRALRVNNLESHDLFKVQGNFNLLSSLGVPVDFIAVTLGCA